MEAAAATSIFSSSSAFASKPKLTHNCIQSSSPWNPYYALGKCRGGVKFIPQKSSLLVSFRTSALAAVGEILEKSSTNDPASSSSVSACRDTLLPKIDKSGRFCSPRAARELALSIIYAACLEGSDPVRLFEKRINARREIGYEFDKASLTEYNHMSFGGPPVTTRTVEEAEQLLRIDQKASEIGNPSLSNSQPRVLHLLAFYHAKKAILLRYNSSNMFIGGEAEVLSAPPKLIYSKLILRFTRKLLVAVVEKWDSNAAAIEKVAPPNWKSAPAGRILELSILHLAMSEIAVLGTRHQIVINEAVDLAKRFCDGAAPRIVNGCLRTFVKDLEGSSSDRDLETNLAAPAAELQN